VQSAGDDPKVGGDVLEASEAHFAVNGQQKMCPSLTPVVKTAPSCRTARQSVAISCCGLSVIWEIGQSINGLDLTRIAHVPPMRALRQFVTQIRHRNVRTVLLKQAMNTVLARAVAFGAP
jgi:hypothetical protein